MRRTEASHGNLINKNYFAALFVEINKLFLSPWPRVENLIIMTLESFDSGFH